jgi:hypothetical protein
MANIKLGVFGGVSLWWRRHCSPRSEGFRCETSFGGKELVFWKWMIKGRFRRHPGSNQSCFGRHISCCARYATNENSTIFWVPLVRSFQSYWTSHQRHEVVETLER